MEIVRFRGFTIEIGAALTVLLASKIGIPISTTHCKVGSVVCVGYSKGKSDGVDWKIFRYVVPVFSKISNRIIETQNCIFVSET